MDLRHLPVGTPSLAPRPGSLVRLAFQKWSAWQELHLQPSRFERVASAIGLHAVGAPGQDCTDTKRGLSPLPLLWATGAEMVLALRTREPAVKAASQLIAWPRPAAPDFGSDQLVPREGLPLNLREWTNMLAFNK